MAGTHVHAPLLAIAAAIPPIEGESTGGDASIVMAFWVPAGGNWRVTGGASYLQVIDVGACDNSLMLNLPGQVNDPRSEPLSGPVCAWARALYRPSSCLSS